MFDPTSRFWQFLNKMTDLFLLTLLWAVCCIPIFTIGAATTSYFSILMELHQDLEGTVFADFFRRMRRYFTRATRIWLAELAFIILIAVDLRLCWIMKNQVGYFLLPMLAMLLLCLMTVGFYALALVAHSKAPLKQLVRCAAQVSVDHIAHSISMLVMIVLCAVMAGMYPVLIMFLPGLMFYQYARIFVWAFRRSPRTRPLLDKESFLAEQIRNSCGESAE